MLKSYRMLLVVQGSCSVLHNNALGFNRDIVCCCENVASGSVGSFIFDKGLIVIMVLCYGMHDWHFLVCGGGSFGLQGVMVCNWIGKKRKTTQAAKTTPQINQEKGAT